MQYLVAAAIALAAPAWFSGGKAPIEAQAQAQAQ
jgi:hypothetical protein